MRKNVKHARKDRLLYVSILTSTLLLFTGLACFGRSASLALGLTGAVLMLLPVLTAGIEKSIGRRFKQQQAKKTAEELQKERLALREDDKAVKRLTAKLAVIRRLTCLQAVVFILCGIGADLLTPALITLIPVITLRIILMFAVLTVWPAFLIFLGFTQIPPRNGKYVNAAASALNDKDYPLLNACACMAAKESGFNKQFCILLTRDRNIGITPLHGGAVLTLDAVLVNLFTEAELTACLRHEFAHITDSAAKRVPHKEERYAEFLKNIDFDHLTISALRFFYGYLHSCYLFAYECLNYAASLGCELAADKAMLPGGVKNAASMLTKLFCESCFEFEDRWEDHPFPDDEILSHSGEKNLHRFLDAAQNKMAFWLSLIGKEIPSRRSTHPTLAMRLEALGEPVPEVSFELPEGAWKDERLRLLRESDRKSHEQFIRNGSEKGIKSSAEYIAEWESNSEPVDPQTYPDILNCLFYTGQILRGKELCDRILQDEHASFPDKALLYRGQWRLGHYDDGGLDDLKHYIKLNSMDVYFAYDLIGDYCCRMGLQKELDAYRRDTIAKAQSDRTAHMEKAGVIVKKDLASLSPYHFKDKAQEDELIRLVRSVSKGQVDELYLIRQKLIEGREACVIVVHYDVMIEPELQQEIAHRLNLYLDSLNEEWCYLKDYSDLDPNVMKKLEACRVYENSME